MVEGLHVECEGAGSGCGQAWVVEESNLAKEGYEGVDLFGLICFCLFQGVSGLEDSRMWEGADSCEGEMECDDDIESSCGIGRCTSTRSLGASPVSFRCLASLALEA